ncbi:WD40-repeat-containing domain protein [Crassisporium funariophilum]|nr:WD40-repeat-containing domain protein [Crassisporium funariophilum]
MTHYPHSRLFVGTTRTIAIAGPHIQVLETSTGHVLHSTARLEGEAKEGVQKAGPVRCAAMWEERWVVVVGEDKMLKVWEVDGLRLVSERELPKKATAVAFTGDGGTILVSDKFGDIFSYPFDYVPLTVKQKRDALSSHENPSGGQLILGHASPLNAFLLTSDEKYIITADRDEHIRVSWYPKGYNIEMYCLGHLKFVSAIHIPKSDTATLISGGGDPMLKIWNWMTGEVKHEISVADAVEPFMAVRAVKRKWYACEDDGEEGAEGARVKSKKGRGKGKAKQAQAQEDADGEEEESGTPVAGVPEAQQAEGSKPQKVLVIQKIETLDSDAGVHIIFSAVGTTALFAVPYTSDSSAAGIQHFDFGRPVLEFYVLEDGGILVSLDGQWQPDQADASVSPSENKSTVRTLRFISGKFVEVHDVHNSLVQSLNSDALLQASKEDLKALDLYIDLTSMPKYHTETDPDLLPTLPTHTSTLTDEQQPPKAELSKKVLGRMKSKKAVMAVVQQQQLMDAGAGNEAVLEEEDEEPGMKRAREDAGEVVGEDVVMASAE